jgi:hypothetical protein
LFVFTLCIHGIVRSAVVATSRRQPTLRHEINLHVLSSHCHRVQYDTIHYYIAYWACAFRENPVYLLAYNSQM